eukprot:TRINITY_DN151_c0_g2_i1.p1 TRINITY_DN151_c0_g2~~TRINITY_DN151_c0_g2_i1.p1  ORF type:complete len:566 (+),score=159.05 TRINITY_DN151_c0_g2_i1:154-1698(+)
MESSVEEDDSLEEVVRGRKDGEEEKEEEIRGMKGGDKVVDDGQKEEAHVPTPVRAPGTPSLDPPLVCRASSEISELDLSVSDSSDFGEDTESDRSASSMELGRNKLEEMSLSYLTSRPEGLPPKDPKESKRQQRQLKMMEEMQKKKMIFEAKKIKQRKKEIVKREDRISKIQVLWNRRLRDNFEVYRHKKTLKKFWKVSAFPSSIRGELWSKCIGNNLGISSALYRILVAKGKAIREAREEIPRSESEGRSAYLAEHSPKSGSPRAQHRSKPPPSAYFGGPEELEEEEVGINREESAALISLDLERTFPTLSFFSEEGPLYHSLWNVLSAYVVYRPDIGYVQGMGYLAATLLLTMDEYDSFVAFCNLLNQHHFYDFFMMDMDRVGAHIRAFEQLLMKTLPDVKMHFDSHNVRCDVFLFEWMLTAFMKTFPLDTACRVWDGFMFEGELFLFRVALGFLKTYRKDLLTMSFEELMLFLTHSKRDVNEEDLFENIRAINLTLKIFDRALSFAKEHIR